jgi:Beta-galactosidase
MELDYRQAFAEICQLGLDRIRLCAYWNELQPDQDRWDFSTLDWLLDRCHQHKIEVVLAIGMKVPRWPEFHFPHWVSDRYDTGAGDQPLDQRSPAVADLTLHFVNTVIDRLRFAPAIRYWQVENEPFTKLEIAGGRFLSPEFVWQEVEMVRSRLWQSQKILLTNAIHLPQPKLEEDEPAFKSSAIAADAVGFNVYTKVPNGNSDTYLEPLEPFWQRLEQWQRILKTYQVEPWIAEAQAEPWEPQKLVAIDRAEYPSATPRRMRSLVTQLTAIGYDTILLWGCEYWYWQRTQRRNLWWHTVEKLIHA